MKEKKEKPKRRAWNTHPTPGVYGRGLEKMFTARLSVEDFEKVEATRKRLKLTRAQVILRGLNLMESEE